MQRIVCFLIAAAGAVAGPEARAEVTRMIFAADDGVFSTTVCEIDPPSFLETCFASPHENQAGWSVDTVKPPGASIQSMALIIDFNDYFELTTGHFAFALNAHTDFTTQAYGRGVIMGAQQGGPTACPFGPMIQVEAFGLASNVLYRHTCNPWPIDDWGDFFLFVEADYDTGLVSFLITDLFGNPLHAWLSIADTTALCPTEPDPELPCHIPPATGWWIAHVTGNTPGISWEVEVKGILVGWR